LTHQPVLADRRQNWLFGASTQPANRIPQRARIRRCPDIGTTPIDPTS
jgi:hypothetical protein